MDVFMNGVAMNYNFSQWPITTQSLIERKWWFVPLPTFGCVFFLINYGGFGGL